MTWQDHVRAWNQRGRYRILLTLPIATIPLFTIGLIDSICVGLTHMGQYMRELRETYTYAYNWVRYYHDPKRRPK